MGLRDDIGQRPQSAMKAGDKRRVSTARLVGAAIKDRDIQNRTAGPDAGIGDAQIVEVLAKMVKQRQGKPLKSMRKPARGLGPAGARGDRYHSGLHAEAVVGRGDEIRHRGRHQGNGRRFGQGHGQGHGALKQRYSGQMDFARAGALLRRCSASSALKRNQAHSLENLCHPRASAARPRGNHVGSMVSSVPLPPYWFPVAPSARRGMTKLEAEGPPLTG